jgi:hypothetical protein
MILSKTCCGKNVEAAENGHIFHIMSVFSALSHTPELYMQHTKPLQLSLESTVLMSAISAF